jgi:hypothetical protein
MRGQYITSEQIGRQRAGRNRFVQTRGGRFKFEEAQHGPDPGLLNAGLLRVSRATLTVRRFLPIASTGRHNKRRVEDKQKRRIATVCRMAVDVL